ncbi:MAG: PIN domain-containing protein, partial [Candidatus Woesebacteria bacterium]|nr:PIN domain-containing protein [Candidatus Woesebacteria bacterium]
MDSKFVDTNIFLEIFARDGVKSVLSKKFLKKERNLMTTDFVISEIEWVLRTAYKLDREKISNYLKQILTSDIEIENKKFLINILNFYEANNVDWTDCLNMFSIKRKGIEIVYSYD